MNWAVSLTACDSSPIPWVMIVYSTVCLGLSTCYQYVINKDHFSQLAGFDNIYGYAAKHR